MVLIPLLLLLFATMVTADVMVEFYRVPLGSNLTQACLAVLPNVTSTPPGYCSNSSFVSYREIPLGSYDMKYMRLGGVQVLKGVDQITNLDWVNNYLRAQGFFLREDAKLLRIVNMSNYETTLIGILYGFLLACSLASIMILPFIERRGDR